MKFRRWILSLVLIFTFIITNSHTVFAKVEWPSAPGISSDGGIIMDADTGTVLYSKNINTEMYPASITKLMTVLLVLENCSLDQTLTFSKEAVFNIEFGSNHIGMNVGEQITVEQALYGILLESANEVSNGVGELISGDQESFVALMNKRAQELGCKHTHFMNANGLHDKQHYSSPYDMALIARECLKYPDFKRIAGAKSYQLQPTNKVNEVRYLNSQHKMFPGRKNAYEGFECGKTGFTNQALNTLVTIAKRDNLELICVTMHGNLTQYTDTATLLDYGFKNYKNLPISSQDPNLTNNYYLENESSFKDFINGETDYSVEYDKNALMVLPNNASFSDITTKITDVKKDAYSLTANIEYYYDQDLMGTQPVTIKKKVPEPSPVDKLSGDQPLIITVIKVILIIIGILLIGFIALYFYARYKVKQRRRKRRRHYEDDYDYLERNRRPRR